MKMVSIIIPVYNVERYLKRCIDSVLTQTYKNLEIILVNDGSTDHCGDICEEYKAKNPEVIQVFHKPNGGLSDARNYGLDHVHGEYITFIDSDDFVENDYVQSLVELLENNSSDISIVGYKSVKADERGNGGRGTDKVYKYSSKSAMEDLLYQKNLSTSACAKLYKAGLFCNIRFPKGRLYEDVNTIYKVFLLAHSIVYSDCIKYYYFIRNDSIVHSGFNPRKMDYVVHCWEVALAVKKIYPDLYSAAISRFVWANIHVWVNIDKPSRHKEIYKELTDNIAKYRYSVLKDHKVPSKNKLIIAITYFGWHITKGVYCLSKLL